MNEPTLKEKIVEATEKAVEAAGGPVKIGAILAAAEVPEGYVRDYRDAILEVTEVVAWTDYGDPLRDVSSD